MPTMTTVARLITTRDDEPGHELHYYLSNPGEKDLDLTDRLEDGGIEYADTAEAGVVLVMHCSGEARPLPAGTELDGWTEIHVQAGWG